MIMIILLVWTLVTMVLMPLIWSKTDPNCMKSWYKWTTVLVVVPGIIVWVLVMAIALVICLIRKKPYYDFEQNFNRLLFSKPNS